MAARPPAQAASVVLAATRPMPPASIADSVEPGLKPYQPNQRMTPPTDGDGQVVGGRHAAAVALELAAEAGPEGDGADEGDRAADRVHDGRSREVTERHARGGEPAVRAPDPVPDDRVDEARHADGVQEVALEPCAADHGARRDGRAGVGPKRRAYRRPRRCRSTPAATRKWRTASPPS